MEFILKNLKTLPNSDKIINDYKNDIKLCKKAGEKEADCTKLVDLKYTRKFPVLKDLVYPWVNYDWDYTTYVDRNYNKDKTGATDRASLGGLFDDMDAMAKLSDGYVFDANPGSHSKAGISDTPKCDPKKDGYQGCVIMNDIKRSIRDQPPPFPDRFFNKGINGHNSSSYFIKAGTCPKPSLSKRQCNAKGYTWVENPLFAETPSSLIPSDFISGSCFKPKYAYIKNTPGIELDFGDIADINKSLGNLAIKASGGISKLASKGVGMAGSASGHTSDARAAQAGINAGSAMGGAGVGAGVAMSNAGLAMAQGPINAMLSFFKGAVPSMMGDAISINPLALRRVMKGQATNDFIPMSCEGFSGCGTIGTISNPDKWWSTILFLILIVTTTLVLLSFLKYGQTKRLISVNHLSGPIISLIIIVIFTVCLLMYINFNRNL